MEDESTWTIEDRKLLRIQLVKADERTKDHCWLSLLEGQFTPDPITLNEMRKKLDLERFQLEVKMSLICYLDNCHETIYSSYRILGLTSVVPNWINITKIKVSKTCKTKSVY